MSAKIEDNCLLVKNSNEKKKSEAQKEIFFQ